MRIYTDSFSPQEQACLEQSFDAILADPDVAHVPKIMNILLFDWERGLDFPIQDLFSFFNAMNTFVHSEDGCIREGVTGAKVLLFAMGYAFPELIREEACA